MDNVIEAAHRFTGRQMALLYAAALRRPMLSYKFPLDMETKPPFRLTEKERLKARYALSKLGLLFYDVDDHQIDQFLDYLDPFEFLTKARAKEWKCYSIQ